MCVNNLFREVKSSLPQQLQLKFLLLLFIIFHYLLVGTVIILELEPVHPPQIKRHGIIIENENNYYNVNIIEMHALLQR